MSWRYGHFCYFDYKHKFANNCNDIPIPVRTDEATVHIRCIPIFSFLIETHCPAKWPTMRFSPRKRTIVIIWSFSLPIFFFFSIKRKQFIRNTKRVLSPDLFSLVCRCCVHKLFFRSYLYIWPLSLKDIRRKKQNKKMVEIKAASPLFYICTNPPCLR